MADPSLNSNSTFTSNPLKQKEEEEKAPAVIKESKLRPRRRFKEILKIEELNTKYRDLILTLPIEQRWSIRQYQGFWHWERILPAFLTMKEVFKPHPSDIILASFPKSGTTWLKSLIFTVVHRNKYAFSSHPLLKLNAHDCVPQLEAAYALLDEQHFETLPSPRVFGTHAPYSMLPESLKASKCPIVYICREPKDALVSFWHMFKMFDWLMEPLPFAQAFELFCQGKFPYGPIWDHMLEYYTKSLQSPDKILFLKYEEMMNDPIDGVIRLASFIGCPFSEEEKKKGVVEEIVWFCSFDKQKNLDVNKKDGINGTKNDYFFRKAVVGDWQNYMTAEMATKMDEISKEKLQGSIFTY